MNVSKNLVLAALINKSGLTISFNIDCDNLWKINLTVFSLFNEMIQEFKRLKEKTRDTLINQPR